MPKSPLPTTSPPSAQRSSVDILDRRPAPPNQREVSLFYCENGQRLKRSMIAGRPTRFDDITVAVVDGVSPLPKSQLGWPGTLRDVARFGYHMARDVRSSLAAPMNSGIPMFDVRKIEPNNLAHLLMDVVPLALHGQIVLQGEMVSVFRDVRGPFRELLDILNVKCAFTPRRLEGRMVRIRGTRGLMAWDLLGTFDVSSITFLPDIYSGFSFDSAWKPEKIFIARRGARSLLNQAEVERILTSYGYQTVFMEDHSVTEQLGIAAQAKHAVGIHGAGMASLIMNKGLESVIEFLPPHVYHDFFPACLDKRVKRYMLLMPEFDLRVQQCDWPEIASHKSAPFAVDLEALEQALDQAGHA